MRQNMKYRFRRVNAILKYNQKTFLGYEVLIKLTALFLIVPIIGGMLFAAMELTGHSYLTPENIGSFVRNPLSIVFGIIALLLISIYTLADMAGILIICNESFLKRKMPVLQVVRFVFQTLIRCLKKENIGMMIIPILYIFLLFNGALFAVLTTLTVPEFLLVLLRRARYVVSAVIIVYLLLLLCGARRMHVAYYFVVEHQDYKVARKNAIQIGRSYRKKDFAQIILFEVIYYIVYLVTLGLGLGIALIVSNLFGKMTLFSNITLTALWISMALVLLLFLALSIPSGMMVIMFRLFDHKAQKGELIHSVYEKEKNRIHLKQKTVYLIEILFTVCMLLGGYIWFRGSMTGSLNPAIEFLHTTEITAHRGASRECPENTLVAFEKAVEQGTDWIELDVQQSRDGQVFVMHDNSFRRTTGLRKSAWELDYDEITQLDAGGYKNKEFAGERIPLLSEVIDFAKEENVRLNIEMKPNGHNAGIEQKVVDLIREKEFQDYCVITSQAYYMLRNIKEIDDSISTVYVMSLAAGNLNKLTAADSFSIEANSITKRMVSRIHNAGKQVFAWTVNSSGGMKRMMDMNVDNIITDNVNLAYKSIYEMKTNDIVRQYVRFLLQFTPRGGK